MVRENLAGKLKKKFNKKIIINSKKPRIQVSDIQSTAWALVTKRSDCTDSGGGQSKNCRSVQQINSLVAREGRISKSSLSPIIPVSRLSSP